MSGQNTGPKPPALADGQRHPGSGWPGGGGGRLRARAPGRRGAGAGAVDRAAQGGVAGLDQRAGRRSSPPSRPGEVVPAAGAFPAPVTAAMRLPPPAMPVDGPAVPVAPTLPTPPALPALPPVDPVAVPIPPGDWPKLPAAEPLAPLAPPPELVEPPPSAPLAPPTRPEFPLPPAGSGSNVGSTAAPPTPGDDPMTPKLTALKSALVGAVLAAAPASAQEPKAATPATEKAVESVEAKLTAALKRLTDAEAKIEAQATTIDEQKKALLKLQLTVDGLDGVPGLVKKFENLQTKYDTLQTDYAILKTRLPGDTSTSAKVPQAMPGNPVAPDAAATTTGTVRIINQYATPVKLIVNGVSHTVEPSAVKSIVVTAPQFIYELVGSPGSITQAIKPGETLNLTIN